MSVLADAEAGDEIMSVPRDSVLIASSRDELVLAVMEMVQQIRTCTTNDDTPNRDWPHMIAMCSARPALRLLAGCFDPIIGVLKGESTGVNLIEPTHTRCHAVIWSEDDAVITCSAAYECSTQGPHASTRL